MRRLAIAFLTLTAVALTAWPLALAANDASCSVAASSLADSMINPPTGEDMDFFVTTGGVPNVALVLDTSESMRRVAPDGAARTWGSFEDPTTTYGCVNAFANNDAEAVTGLRYNSSCGTTTKDGHRFDGTFDYAQAKDLNGNYCPYMNQAGTPMKTDKPGYDPDFYPTFFPGLATATDPTSTNVYRDVVGYLPPVGDTPDLTPTNDGWTDAATSPASAGVGAFCNQFSADATKMGSCNTCLATRGYWFDGTYLTASSGVTWHGPTCTSTDWCAARGFGMCVKANGGEKKINETTTNGMCRIPNVWLSGNFLNFHPPKFIVARKVLKDVLAGVKLFRLGIYTFDGLGGGAKEVSQLNPPCGNALSGRSAFFNNRNSDKATINNNTKVSFTGPAPLAEALLDIGHLYKTGALPWFNAAYANSAFNERNANNRSICVACQKSSVIFVTDGSPTSDAHIPGTDFAASAITATLAHTAGNNAGMDGENLTGISAADCPTCGSSAELADATIPSGLCYGQQATGACTADHNAVQSYLPNVAWYLHNMDYRSDTEVGTDGYPMTGAQSIDVYTIGLGVRDQMADLLRDTADAGGGKFFSTTGGRDLRNAIDQALQDVNTRSIGFGAPSLSTLQASASQGVLVPRFVPSRKALWNGHLYAFDLWSEFTGGCTIPATGPSGPANGDYDCDGKCTSVFLREKGSLDGSGKWVPGAFIQENENGAFVRNFPANLAACGNGQPSTCPCAALADSTQLATPYWDAGDLLSPYNPDGTQKPATGTSKGFKAWTERRIFTVIDDAEPHGAFTAADSVVQLADDSTTVGQLLPYLNVVGNQRFCDDLASRLIGAGNTVGTTIRSEIFPTDSTVTPTYTTCGKVVIEYAMGADVFNERRCSGFPTSYCTRPYQLGDIFHSSPVEVWPPLASDGLLCPRGLHPQCLPSLFSASIDAPSLKGNANAYDDYAKSTAYKHRDKFALVGANDGMLHAVLSGHWHSNNNGACDGTGDDPRTTQREDCPPYEGYHDIGTGEELWAFVPPDLLAKLHLLTLDDHHYFVDATPMVRDVWIDGGINGTTGNALASDAAVGAPNANGKREGSEFFTVAVVGLRRGGTHYFALDVTDASSSSGTPRFLWLYPQPSDKEQLSFGETYADFVPTPPPVGPVRVDAGASSLLGCTGNHKVYQTTSGANRCFEERWVVMLSGGFDPQYARGRGVHMVEIGTGKELWDFSQPAETATACVSSSDPRCHLNYPVAAPVAMMMWGKTEVYQQAAASDGYFDTATFGDTGGQLWVLRFNDPGTIDSATGKVNNWYGARIFEHGKTGTTPDCGLDYCGTQPFFHITANLPLQASQLYRVLAGTGDRANLMDPTGGICSPTNLRACILKGCSVQLEAPASLGGGDGAVYQVDYLGARGFHLNQVASCSSFDPTTFSSSDTGPTATTCSVASPRVRQLTISCPKANVCAGSYTNSDEIITKDVAVDCTNGYCKIQDNYDYGSAVDLMNDTGMKNWFFSVLVFDPSTVNNRQIFNDLAGATRYDGARLNETSLASINAHDASPATNPLASATGPGWSYYFDHGKPNASGTTTVLGDITHTLYRSDERVASTTAVEASCAFWNTLQVALPSGALDPTTGCPVNSPCKAGKKQLSYLYGANPGTGDQCLYVGGSPARSTTTQTLVPPHIGKLVAYVSSGQVSFGLTSVRIPQGGTNISLGDAQDVTSIMQWIPLDRQTEACRHSSKTGTPPTNCK